jgi:hypothetical protein
MLQAEELPARVADLDAGLAKVEAEALTHLEGRVASRRKLIGSERKSRELGSRGRGKLGSRERENSEVRRTM